MPIFRSVYPSFKISTDDAWGLLFEREKKGPEELRIPEDKILWIELETNRTLTYGEIRDRSRELGAKLKKKYGLKKGDVVVFGGQNTLEAGLAIFGCFYIGVTVALVNAAMEEQLASSKALLEASQAKAAIVSLDSAPKFEAAGLNPENIMVLSDAKLPEDLNKYQSFYNLENIQVSSEDVQLSRLRCEPEDLCLLVSTSGTTSPIFKFAKFPHRTLSSSVMQKNAIEKVRGRRSTDVGIAAYPWRSSPGIVLMLVYPIYAGLTNVVWQVPPFDFTKFLTAVQDYKVTYFYTNPPLVDAFINYPHALNFDLSTVRSAISSGSALAVAAVRRFKEKFGFRPVQAYGASEVGAISFQLEAEWEETAGSVGKLVPNVELKIISLTTGEELDYDSEEAGELWIRGPTVTPWGYFSNDAANKASYSEDGQWYKMGDLGRITRGGDIYLLGRAKDLIHFTGCNGAKSVLSPEEAEGVLRLREEVVDVAVKATKSDDTYIPKAYVQLKEGIEGNDDRQRELREFARKKTGYEERKIPLQLAFVPEIPRSPAGKILRRLLP